MQKKAAVLAVFLLLLGGLVHALDVGDEPAVSVRAGDLRSAPGFLSGLTATLEYGETVTVLEIRGDWLRVQAAGSEGWIHRTAVAEKQALRLERSEDTRTGTTSREIALAGRGFNEQVEAKYKNEKALDFTVVDEMEEYEQPVESLAQFLAEGDLSIDEGGDR